MLFWGEMDVVRGVPEPSELSSPDSCQQRLLWADKGVDLAPHPVVGLLFRLGYAEKLPRALGLERLDPGFFVHGNRELRLAVILRH